MSRACLVAMTLAGLTLSLPLRGGVVDRTKAGAHEVYVSIDPPPDSWIDDDVPYNNCYAPELYRHFNDSTVGVSCQALTTGVVTLGPFTAHGPKRKDHTLPAVRTRAATPWFDVGAAIRQARSSIGAPIAVQVTTSPVKAFEGETTIVGISVLTQENIASIGVSITGQDGLEVESVPVEGRGLALRGRLDGVDLQRIAGVRLAVRPLRTGEIDLTGVRLTVRHWSPGNVGLRPGFSAPPDDGPTSELTLDVPPVRFTVATPEAPVTTSPRVSLKCEASRAVPGLPIWVRASTYLDGRTVPMPDPEVDGSVVESATFDRSPEGRATQVWLLRFDPSDSPRKVPEISMPTWNAQTGLQIASCTPEATVPALPVIDVEAAAEEGHSKWLTPYHVRLAWSLSTLVSGLSLLCVAALVFARRLSRRRS